MSALLALAAITLSGIGIVSPAWRDGPPGLARRTYAVALGLALGLGVWSGLSSAILLAGLASPGARFARDAGLVLAGAVLLATRRRPPGRSVEDRRAAPRGLTVLFIACSVLALAVFAGRTVRVPDGEWDAWGCWNLRARLLHRGEGDPALAFSPELAWTRPDYPAMVPVAIAEGWRALGSEWTLLPALGAAASAALVVALLVSGVATLRGPSWGLGAGLVLLATPTFLFQAVSQYADVPLALFVLSAHLIVVLAPERRFSQLAVAGAAAGAAAWTKNEGLLHLLALGAALALAPRPGWPRGRSLAAYLAGALPFLGLLGAFKAGWAPLNDMVRDTPGPLVAVARAADLDRLSTVATAFVAEPFHVRHWSVLLLAVLGLRFLGRRPAGNERPVAAALRLSLAGFAVVYLVTPRPLDWHLSTSLARIAMQVYPSLVLLAVLALPADSRPVPGPPGRIRTERAPSCPVCAGAGDPAGDPVADRWNGVPGAWTFRRCRGCGSRWLDPRPVPQDLALAYPEDYSTHQVDDLHPRLVARLRANGLRARWLFRVLTAMFGSPARRPRRVRWAHRLLRVHPWIDRAAGDWLLLAPGRGRLLDVGCGNGGILACLRELGWDVVGLEPDLRAARVARERFGLDVVSAAFEEARLPAASFDVVTLGHVIEHVPDPLALLVRCRDWLRPGGSLHLLTPNAGALGCRMLGPAWRALDPPRHLVLLTPAALSRLAEEAGFEVALCTTSARMTRWIWRASIEAGPVGALLAHAIEHLLVSMGLPVGEEVALVAFRSAS